jgi:hypothetical protein
MQNYTLPQLPTPTGDEIELFRSRARNRRLLFVGVIACFFPPPVLWGLLVFSIYYLTGKSWVILTNKRLLKTSPTLKGYIVTELELASVIDVQIKRTFWKDFFLGSNVLLIYYSSEKGSSRLHFENCVKAQDLRLQILKAAGRPS